MHTHAQLPVGRYASTGTGTNSLYSLHFSMVPTTEGW